MVYVCLDKKYIDVNADRMLEKAKREFGEGDQQYLYIDGVKGEIVKFDREKCELIIDCNFPWGFISFNVPIDSDTLIKILECSIEHSINQLNKLKTILEVIREI